MEKFLVVTLLVLFINVDTFITTLACPYCPYPYPSPPPKVKPPSPPKVKPPPSPPKVKPPLSPPKVKPPPSPPKVKPPPSPPKVKPPPSPPKVKPPTPPKFQPPSPPPKVNPPSPEVPCPPPPPKVNPPSPEVPCPPPPPSAKPKTCPIDILKLDACVDVLGGLVHVGIGPSAESKCCPVLHGLADLDAALCLCTTIKAKVLNIKVYLPIALQLLLDCGKHLPSDFQCPA